MSRAHVWDCVAGGEKTVLLDLLPSHHPNLRGDDRARQEALTASEARELGEELLHAASRADPCQFGLTVDGSRGRGWCNAHQRLCRFEELFRIGSPGGPWPGEYR